MIDYMNDTEFNFRLNFSETGNVTSCVANALFNATLGNITSCDDNPTTTEDASILVGPPNGCESGFSYMRWFGDVVITPPIIAFGIIGNILSFIVLCIQKPYLTTSILLSYLAVVDTLILLAAIPLRVVRQVQVCHGVLEDYHDIYALYIFRWGFPCMYVLRLAGTWLTTVLTVDRYIAVCKPLHAQRIVTNELAIGQIVGISVASIIMSLPNFFEFTYVKKGIYTQFQYYHFATTQWYIIGYKVVFLFLVGYIIPMAIMVIFNVRLCIKLKVAAKDRALLQRSASFDSTRPSSSVTMIVIAVVATFLVCNTLPLISHTLWLLEKCFPTLEKSLVLQRRYVANISNVFVTINSAVNFLIYCVCSRSFRTTFKREFMCRVSNTKLRRTQGRQSNGSATTNFSLLSNGSNKNCNCGSKENSHYLLSKETSNHNNHKNDHAFHIYG